MFSQVLIALKLSSSLFAIFHTKLITLMHTPRQLLLFLTFLALLSGNFRVHGLSQNDKHLYNFRPSKLFVFGDSYAATGNNRKAVASSWKVPYGLTFPGKPSGRFSDGRVFTDYFARFIGVKSPIPYRWRNFAMKRLKYGMNFAYGGTGVFNTLVSDPNMTTQIDVLFKRVINEKIYTSMDLHSSVALVCLSGNDYGTYIATNNSAQGWQDFITRVVTQIAVNMKSIHEMGVKKVAVNALQPLGCLPQSTIATSYQQCNGTENQLVNFHNLLLQQVVAKLNNETKGSPFVILDLYNAFTSVLTNQPKQTGNTSQFKSPLKPCCSGMGTRYSCGSVDANGMKKYTVCQNPKSAFFWDSVHPTQEGWRAVYLALENSLKQIYKSNA